MEKILYGTFAICGVDERGEICGLQGAQLDAFAKQYDSPMLFFLKENGIQVVYRGGEDYYAQIVLPERTRDIDAEIAI